MLEWSHKYDVCRDLIVDLGQKGHDNINEAEHAGQGNIDIKIHISVEGDCPAKGD